MADRLNCSRYQISDIWLQPISDIFNCSLSTNIRYFRPADIRCQMKIHPISDIFKFADIRYPIFPSLPFVTDTISDILKKSRYLPISDISENRYAISDHSHHIYFAVEGKKEQVWGVGLGRERIPIPHHRSPFN